MKILWFDFWHQYNHWLNYSHANDVIIVISKLLFVTNQVYYLDETFTLLGIVWLTTIIVTLAKRQIFFKINCHMSRLKDSHTCMSSFFFYIANCTLIHRAYHVSKRQKEMNKWWPENWSFFFWIIFWKWNVRVNIVAILLSFIESKHKRTHFTFFNDSFQRNEPTWALLDWHFLFYCKLFLLVSNTICK